MANSASLQLFELISSMTRSEKRYFKIYIRTHASKHEEDYVHLFGLVELQKQYDEDAVIESMQQSGPTQRFAVLKHRLFEKILDALESYKRSTDEPMRLRHEINRAQVLMNRGMERVAAALLSKVQEQAMCIEEYETVLDASALTLAMEESYKGKAPENFETAEVLNHITNGHTLIEIKERVKHLLRENGRSGSDLEELSGLEECVQGLMSNQNLSPKSTYLANHVMAVLEFAKTNISKSLVHVKNCHNLLDRHPYLENQMPMARVDMWANETYCQVMTHNLDAARLSLQELLADREESLGQHLQLELQGSQLQTLLFYLNKVGDSILDSRLKEIADYYSGSRWEHPPLIRAGIDYGLGLYYHSCGDIGSALRSLNKVLNDGEVRRDEDIYHRTLVFITLLHAESGDRSWMVHSARALKRYLVPRNLLQGTDALLLEYISDYRRARSEEGEYRALERYSIGLREIRKNDEDRISFEHFDFLSWAESHLKNQYPTNKVA